MWAGPHCVGGTTLCGRDHTVWAGPHYHTVWAGPHCVGGSHCVGRITLCGRDHTVWAGPHYHTVSGTILCGRDHTVWAGPHCVGGITLCGRDHTVWAGPHCVGGITLCRRDHTVWAGPHYVGGTKIGPATEELLRRDFLEKNFPKQNFCPRASSTHPLPLTSIASLNTVFPLLSIIMFNSFVCLLRPLHST